MNEKEIAYEICRELNIEWDENSNIPKLNGENISVEDVFNLFNKELD